jgi:hypothetical protein
VFRPRGPDCGHPRRKRLVECLIVETALDYEYLLVKLVGEDVLRFGTRFEPQEATVTPVVVLVECHFIDSLRIALGAFPLEAALVGPADRKTPCSRLVRTSVGGRAVSK